MALRHHRRTNDDLDFQIVVLMAGTDNF